MQPDELQERIISKMNAARVAAPAIHAFLGAVAKVRAGDNGQVPEAAIEPVPAVPSLESMPAAGPAHAKLLNQLAVIKLNGGLGTGMGLDKAKSLMPVKGGETFLDFIARQSPGAAAGTGFADSVSTGSTTAMSSGAGVNSTAGSVQFETTSG